MDNGYHIWAFDNLFRYCFPMMKGSLKGLEFWKMIRPISSNSIPFFVISSSIIGIFYSLIMFEINWWNFLSFPIKVDENSLEMKLWPRSAALAERMWSNPTDDWRAAEQRLMHHRQLLVDRGIKADALKPAWCYQNSGLCT